MDNSRDDAIMKEKLPKRAICVSGPMAKRRYLRLCASDADHVRKVGKRGDPISAPLVGVGLDAFVGLDAVVLDTSTKALFNFNEDGSAHEIVVDAQDLSVKIVVDARQQ